MSKRKFIVVALMLVLSVSLFAVDPSTEVCFEIWNGNASNKILFYKAWETGGESAEEEIVNYLNSVVPSIGGAYQNYSHVTAGPFEMSPSAVFNQRLNYVAGHGTMYITENTRSNTTSVILMTGTDPNLQSVVEWLIGNDRIISRERF